MARTRSFRHDPGNAISIEDALSIMIVTFVLFVLFLIPLVNIDRMKLEQAQKDTYWAQLAAWISDSSCSPTLTQAYRNAFGLHGQRSCAHELPDLRYIESVHVNGTVSVIMHRISAGSYVEILTRENSAVATYRIGELHWSSAEKEWFSANNILDYGENAAAFAMHNEYRAWSRKRRGF